MTNPSHIPKKDIEKHTIDLILAYEKESGGPIRPPVPVFDIIEYLGYDIDFRSDGFYQDPNNLGGLHIDEKLVVINEKISGHEGRMNFTAAHEVGHIQLHVPDLTKIRKKIRSCAEISMKILKVREIQKRWRQICSLPIY